MGSYEFWDELGKIFNAVVAYQEKNIEFNKRFISPWIRLGNVFAKQDQNKEAIEAYQKAIELAPDNAENWFELGNVHFKMESYQDAAEAFRKAIELDAGFGWAHSNLALTLVAQGNFEQAIPLYHQAIELLGEDKDKAVTWNRLGNVYRKMNQYEPALEAFHKADELDRENAGFRDSLDEVPAAPTLVQSNPDGTSEAQAAVNVSPIELIVAESRAEEAASQAAEENATSAEPTVAIAAAPDATLIAEAPPEAVPAAQDAAVAAPAEASAEAAPVEAQPSAGAPATETAVDRAATVPAAEAEAAPASADAPAAEVAAAVPEQPVAEAAETGQATESPAAAAPDAPALVEETVTIVVQDTIETFTETLPLAETTTETSDAALTTEIKNEAAQPTAPENVEVVVAEEAPVAADAAPEAPAAAEITDLETQATQPVAAVKLEAPTEPLSVPSEVHAEGEPSTAESAIAQDPDLLDVPAQIAYEEFLKDTNEPIQLFELEGAAGPDATGSQEPVAKLDESGELQIEMDTKNAHVWNELGNVYFNTNAYDDAIVAYSKAIELDRWFAWPYSNLALAYVQKRRFVEAILLYQRSIELFSGDKDKAISWNRLGNVYRRLNDYENAIAAYQRADALDPDNATLSLQNRFSLLGNYAVEQKPSYVS
jgi:tetratricopeptide (TPR) repeat protein